MGLSAPPCCVLRRKQGKGRGAGQAYKQTAATAGDVEGGDGRGQEALGGSEGKSKKRRGSKSKGGADPNMSEARAEGIRTVAFALSSRTDLGPKAHVGTGGGGLGGAGVWLWGKGRSRSGGSSGATGPSTSSTLASKSSTGAACTYSTVVQQYSVLPGRLHHGCYVVLHGLRVQAMLVGLL